ncbi:MAG: DNA methyltransferase [Syntrophales bacterium]|jgi:DNA modification methylase
MNTTIRKTKPIQRGATAVTFLPMGQIHASVDNPRSHKDRQIKALAKSIESFGFNMPIAVDAQGKVLAGHARLEAAKRLGMERVPVIRLDHLSAEQAKAFMIADNRLSEMSSWDDHLLKVHLKELSAVELDFDLEAIGFTVGEIDLRIEGGEVDDDSSDDEFLQNQEGPAITQSGDLWLLGPHRLLCANSQEAQSFDRLMNGQSAGMVITDPPYNVKVQGHVGGKGKIRHCEFKMASGEMSSPEFTQFLRNSFSLLVRHSSPGSIHAIFMDWRHLPEIISAGQQTYSALLNMCVWVKNQAGMGSLYRSQHELVLIYKNGKACHQNNVQLGRFGRYRSNVWQYGGIQAMRHGEEGDLLAMHPTVKPVRMIADAVLDCSKRGDIVLDPFLGSGTTLLAVQRIGRHCYGMELDPVYMDTAIRRWQNMTGEDAVDAVTGKTLTQKEAQSKKKRRGGKP